MSTSPSWFDQEKFSRLVKKLGKTTRTAAAGARSAPLTPLPSPSTSAPASPVPSPPAATPASEATAPKPSAPEVQSPVVPANDAHVHSSSFAIPKPAFGLSLFTHKTAPAVSSQAAAVPALKAPEASSQEEPKPLLTAKTLAPSPEKAVKPPPLPSVAKISEPETKEAPKLPPSAPIAKAPEPSPEKVPKPPLFPPVAKTPEPVSYPQEEPQAQAVPVSSAAESSVPAHDQAPERPPGASAPVVRVFIAPDEAEASSESAFDEGTESGSPMDISTIEVPVTPLPPQRPVEKMKPAASFQVAGFSPVAPKMGASGVGTKLQRIPRLLPPAPPTAPNTGHGGPSLPPVPPPLPAKPADSIGKPAEPLDDIEDLEVPSHVDGLHEPAVTPAPSEWKSSVAPLDEIAAYKEQIAYLNQERDNLAAKVAEFSLVARERDEASLEATTLRDRLVTAETALRERSTAVSLEAATLRDQLDAAQATAREQSAAASLEIAAWRDKLAAAETAAQEQSAAASIEIAALRDKLTAAEAAREQGANNEIALVTRERDAARRDYTELRQHYEKLKLELKSLCEQITQAKEENAATQRGLELSQKALQEARDALRDAGDNKEALDNVKKERTTLVQQNMLLQAQMDQVSRELSALKAKLSK
ncbi:MAG TPA: hypothetical protein VL981_01460 [Candidatus Methylacidiphilales bacterium]|nr:hypothetical protein [Candidatus Methylacidiphilales bacterium]